MPAPSNPLGAHPYIYAENNPIMKKDLSGQAPTGYYRGARMGGQSFFLGTDRPTGEGQIIDCCADGYTTLDPGQIMGSHLWNTMLQGSAPLSQWASWAGWAKDTSLCEMDVREAQPNVTCTKDFTFGGPALLCTYLEICLGAKCPPYKHPGCPKGMTPYEVGHEGNVFEGNLSPDQELDLIIKLFYEFVIVQQQFLVRQFIEQYPEEPYPNVWARSGPLNNIWATLTGQASRSGSWPYACADWADDIANYINNKRDWQHWIIEPGGFGIQGHYAHQWVNVSPSDPAVPSYMPGINLDAFLFGLFGVMWDPTDILYNQGLLMYDISKYNFKLFTDWLVSLR